MFRKDQQKLSSDWLNKFTNPLLSMDTIKVSSDELKTSLFLRICSILSVFTSIIGVIQILIHLYLIYSGKSSYIHISSLSLIIIHLYFAGFGIIIVSIEYELQIALHYFYFCESWIGRGAFLFFNGIMLNILVSLNIPTAALTLCTIESIVLCTFGGIYFVLGLLCFRQLKLREINQVL